MRKYIFMTVSLIFLMGTVFAMGGVSKQDASANPDTAPAMRNNRVVAYYFHGNMRCYTCHAMEKYSKEAIETNFKDELSSGKVVFKAVNTDERGNEHFVQDYQLYTKSLVLSLVKDGKEVKSKNLTKIWDCVRDKKIFFEYVTAEIKDFLREVK